MFPAPWLLLLRRECDFASLGRLAPQKLRARSATQVGARVITAMIPDVEKDWLNHISNVVLVV